MKVEEIAEAVAKLPPDQLARFRRWFTAFEAGRADHAKELDSTATKLRRLAGRAFAELKRRAKEREEPEGRPPLPPGFFILENRKPIPPQILKFSETETRISIDWCAN